MEDMPDVILVKKSYEGKKGGEGGGEAVGGRKFRRRKHAVYEVIKGEAGVSTGVVEGVQEGGDEGGATDL